MEISTASEDASTEAVNSWFSNGDWLIIATYGLPVAVDACATALASERGDL